MVKLITTRITPQMNHQLQAFFHAAVNMNDLNTVKRLIKHQNEAINIEATNSEGIAAIHKCAIEGNTKMISLLLHAGADVNAVDRRGWTCLHAAARSGNLKLCNYLLRKGANPMVYTANQELPIDLSMRSAVTYLLLEVMQLQGHMGLARHHLSRAVAQQKEENESAHAQETNEEPQVLNSILKRRRSSGSSCCSWSSNSSSSSISSFSSADSETETSSVRSSGSLSVQFSTNALFLSYIHENEHELLDVLLDQNRVSILNKLDRKGLSTLHWAAINGFHDCIRVLVKHGADVDIVDPNGWTPLHAAVITGKVECVKELLSCHADIYAVTKSGETMFDMSRDSEIQRLLESRMRRRTSIETDV